MPGGCLLERIAACGSFSAAAATLNMTQSAVNQHVAALERAIDLPLIERGTRPVQLTDAGFALIRPTRAMIAHLGNAEQELAEITGRRQGRLRLGSFPTALATFVPAALARFRQKQPAVALTVIDDHLQRLLPRLDDGELDLAVIYDHDALPEVTARDDLERVHLCDDQYRGRAAARSSPGARRPQHCPGRAGGGHMGRRSPGQRLVPHRAAYLPDSRVRPARGPWL